MVPDGFLCAFSPVLVGQHNVEGMGGSSFPSHRFGTRGSEGVSAADTNDEDQAPASDSCFTSMLYPPPRGLLAARGSEL